MAVLNDEQSMLRDAARDWVREKSPVSALRKVRDASGSLGYDASAFNEMAQMGWAGVVIPEEYGGSDFGYLSLGLVLEEMGRTLVASPLIASALASASALVLAGTQEQKSTWLPKIAAGEAVATLAVDEGPRHDPLQTTLQASAVEGGYSLTGAKTHVLEAMAADLFIVVARTSGDPGDSHGLTLFLVTADAQGLTREARHLADARGYGALKLDNVKLSIGDVLGEVDQGHKTLEKVLDRARAGLAAEMLGAATQAFETTLDYLKTRVQFGQTIGSFQALQHRAAKMFSELELTRSCVEAALSAIDADAPDTPQAVALAKAYAGDTLHLISREMVQMHGGIGMTDAHDAGLYMKRARALEATYGSTAWHRDRWGRMAGY